MQNLTLIWIFVGVCLWGFPSGMLLSYMLAHISFQGATELVSFQADKFKLYIFTIVPLLSFLGFCLGVYMGRLSEKYQKNEQE